MRIAVYYSVLHQKHRIRFPRIINVAGPIMMNFVDLSDLRTTQSLPHHGESVTREPLNCCRTCVVGIYHTRVMMECRFAPRQRMIRPPRPVGQNQCPEDNSQGQLDCRPSGTSSTTYTQVVLPLHLRIREKRTVRQQITWPYERK